MKKIFLFLILAYSYSFANMCTVYSSTYWQGWEDCAYKTSTVNVYGTPITACWNPSTGPYCYAPIPTALATDPNGVCYHDSQGNQVCTKNPDPSGGPRCNDLFQKDGQAYTCNPNTNEATPIPNSDGITPDPEDPDNNIPKCNDGYEYTSIPSMTVGGSGESGYTSWGCSASTNGGNTGTGNTGSTGDGSGGGTGSTGDGNITTKTNPDGSVTMTLPDGTTNTTYGDGVVITTYPDGSTSTTGGSGGVGGTSGGGSGGTSGTGTDGNTSNESETPTPETPIDETPVATSCSDSSLTLQEKMLCEMNAGMKKLNSESSPDNSLNNLINDMNKNLNTNITAVNTNIKTTNQKLDSMKNLQQHQLSQAVITNSKLNSIDTELKNLNTKVDSETANGYINGLDDFINDDTNFQEVKEATSDVTGFLGDKFSQYSDSLKTQLLGLFSSFFSINTTGLPAIGVPYNFNLFGRNFQGAFLDEEMFNILGLDKLSIIVIFLFSMSGFLHAFRFLISSSSPVQTKDK